MEGGLGLGGVLLLQLSEKTVDGVWEGRLQGSAEGLCPAGRGARLGLVLAREEEHILAGRRKLTSSNFV